MPQPPQPPAPTPALLHPRNRHQGRYDFAALVRTMPALAGFVAQTPHGGDPSIDFADPAAVKALNQALLHHYYRVPHWDLPAGYLVPPIPGRADYLHYLADLLADSHGGAVPTGKRVRVLDVGVGAGCIYPILGTREYGWRFVGTDVDATALRMARQIVAANPGLAGVVELRHQPDRASIFSGVLKPKEVFDLTMCNPPFHASAAAAEAANQRKTRNLGTGAGAAPTLQLRRPAHGAVASGRGGYFSVAHGRGKRAAARGLLLVYEPGFEQRHPTRPAQVAAEAGRRRRARGAHGPGPQNQPAGSMVVSERGRAAGMGNAPLGLIGEPAAPCYINEQAPAGQHYR